jgi:hypothetical protein
VRRDPELEGDGTNLIGGASVGARTLVRRIQIVRRLRRLAPMTE